MRHTCQWPDWCVLVQEWKKKIYQGFFFIKIHVLLYSGRGAMRCFEKIIARIVNNIDIRNPQLPSPSNIQYTSSDCIGGLIELTMLSQPKESRHDSTHTGEPTFVLVTPAMELNSSSLERDLGTRELYPCTRSHSNLLVRSLGGLRGYERSRGTKALVFQ